MDDDDDVDGPKNNKKTTKKITKIRCMENDKMVKIK